MLLTMVAIEPDSKYNHFILCSLIDSRTHFFKPTNNGEMGSLLSIDSGRQLNSRMKHPVYRFTKYLNILFLMLII